jgi:hypothetical protein
VSSSTMSNRLDTLRPRFEVAEHLPHALLPGVDVDRLLKLHGGPVTSKVAQPSLVIGQLIGVTSSPSGHGCISPGRDTRIPGFPHRTPDRRDGFETWRGGRRNGGR